MNGTELRTQWLRVMVYSQDGFGLGHMRRTNSIARRLVEARPDAGILTLSDSPLGQIFGTERNQDFLKLPSIFKAGPGDWRSVKLPMPFDEILMMRQNIPQGIHSNRLCKTLPVTSPPASTSLSMLILQALHRLMHPHSN